MIKLEYWLAKRCMTMHELSEKSGININTLTAMRKGKAKHHPKTIGRLAKALECEVEELKN